MSPLQRRIIFLDQGVSAGITIFVIVSIISRYFAEVADTVPLWGADGVARELVKVAFFLPLIASVSVTRNVRRRIARGRWEPLVDVKTIKPLELFADVWLPWRALIMGIFGVIGIAGPTFLWFVLAGQTELSHDAYLWFKPAFIGLLGAICIPITTWVAMLRR